LTIAGTAFELPDFYFPSAGPDVLDIRKLFSRRMSLHMTLVSHLDGGLRQHDHLH